MLEVEEVLLFRLQQVPHDVECFRFDVDRDFVLLGPAVLDVSLLDVEVEFEFVLFRAAECDVYLVFVELLDNEFSCTQCELRLFGLAWDQGYLHRDLGRVLDLDLPRQRLVEQQVAEVDFSGADADLGAEALALQFVDLGFRVVVDHHDHAVFEQAQLGRQGVEFLFVDRPRRYREFVGLAFPRTGRPFFLQERFVDDADFGFEFAVVDELLDVAVGLELLGLLLVQVPGLVDEQRAEVLLLLGGDPGLADEYVGLLGLGLPVVGEEQLGVHVQARDVALGVHVELDALESVAHLELVGLRVAAQRLGLELHLQLEFLLRLQDPARLLDLLPLGQLLFDGFLDLLALGVLAFGFRVLDLFLFLDFALLLRQESEPFVQSDRLVDLGLLDDLQRDLRRQVELLWIRELRLFDGLV